MPASIKRSSPACANTRHNSSVARAATAALRRDHGEHRPHPATSFDLDYSPEELELLSAVESWKTQTGRKFPALADMLAIMKQLGYAKGGAQ